MAVPSPLAQQDRQALRDELRARRRQIAGRYPTALTCPTALRAVLDAAATIALYIPMKNEIDPWPLARPDDVTVAPIVHAADRTMTFARWMPGSPTTGTAWGGREPAGERELRHPDVILVPLLGFDRDFNRIGQGGGYYDRYLAAHPDGRRIGVAWDAQCVEEGIEAQAWDIPLDAILTEHEFYIRDLNR